MTSNMARSTPTVEVVFRSERDVDTWAERHAKGEVPGRWPYGLDQLASMGAQVTARNVAEPGRLATLGARMRGGGPILGSRRAGVPTGRPRDIGVAWDENVAQRMLVGAPHPEMYAGAIWVTDARASGRDDRRVRAVLRTLRRMDGIFVNSRAQVSPLTDALGANGPPVSFFRFGVDTEFFAPRPHPERPLVVSVGGDRDRDASTLFAALERVARARPGVEIVVQSTSGLPAPDGVTKVPRLSHLELRELYARATVVAVATRPNLHMSGLTVSLESMAIGRPVVLTRTPGVDDYFADGSTAMLVTPGDAEGLAERVVGLLDDPDGARRLGQRAQDAVYAGLTSRHMVRGMADAIGLTKP